MSHVDPGPLSAYNSLQDKNLVGYFNNSRMRRHLRQSGLINRRGEIVTESSYRLTMARKEHQRHVRDLMSQAIVHKALDMERHRQSSIKQKLEEIAKLKLVQRVRSERGRKGDEDITPFLSPRAPQGRPHSAHSHRRRNRLGSKQRPLTAPISKTSHEKQKAVFVDEDGFPIHRERTRSDTSEEIDSHNLRELDPKIMNSVSLHMRPEDREGLAPYRVNQSFDPLPPTVHVKTKRSRPRPQKSKTIINKDGKKLRPKTHKGSLALHRKEPAFPHASQLQTLCDVTVRYRGNNLKIQYEREDLRDEIMIYQQHCGGENLVVFEGMAEPGTDLVFTSRRHRGYPFSVTFFVNRVQSLRLSACCEYKYTPHSLLGGAKGHFKFIRVDGAAPCYRCMVEAELARRERQRYRGTQTDQPAPAPEPEPETTMIATQTEETGQTESKDGYEDDFDEDDDGKDKRGLKKERDGGPDHFISGSEKQDKKDTEGYSDSEFEDESDKEDLSKVVQEPADVGEEKKGKDEELVDGRHRSIDQKGKSDSESDESLKSVVMKDVKEDAVDDGDGDAVSSIKSEADQKDTNQEEKTRRDKDERERGIEQKVESTPRERKDREEDSESESEVKQQSSSDEEDEMTSMRSKSRASLSNSEYDYRPLSKTSSSSSSDSEDGRVTAKRVEFTEDSKPEEREEGNHEDKVGEDIAEKMVREAIKSEEDYETDGDYGATSKEEDKMSDVDRTEQNGGNKSQKKDVNANFEGARLEENSAAVAEEGQENVKAESSSSRTDNPEQTRDGQRNQRSKEADSSCGEEGEVGNDEDRDTRKETVEGKNEDVDDISPVRGRNGKRETANTDPQDQEKNSPSVKETAKVIPIVVVNDKPEEKSSDSTLNEQEEKDALKGDVDLNENDIENGGEEERQKKKDDAGIDGTKEGEEGPSESNVPREKVRVMTDTRSQKAEGNTDRVKDYEKEGLEREGENSVYSDEKESSQGGRNSRATASEEETGVTSSSDDDDETRSAVTVLNLNEKGITADKAVKLAASLLKPRYSQVQYLLVRGNPIGDKGLTAIVQSLIKLNGRESKNNEAGLPLTHFDLGDTQIGNRGINELAELLKMPCRVENLNLSDNVTSKLGWLALSAGVRENISLKTLSVEYMKLGDEGCREICEAVADSRTITELNLEGNDIGDEGGEAILKMLRDNERIQTINFERDNNIQSHIAEEIMDLL